MAKLKEKKKLKPNKQKNEKEITVEGIEEPIQMENDSNMLITLQKKVSKAELNEPREKPKKKLTRKERARLEKVLERKEKSSKRNELLEKLAQVQVDSNELKMYSSIRNIGQKEKKKHDLAPVQGETSNNDTTTKSINSIAGSNKRKKGEKNEEVSSTDTDDISTDSEIDEPMIQKAIDNFNKKATEIETNKNRDVESDEETSKPSANSGSVRVHKYVHVERRKDIQVRN